jgi:hypothetical protein
VGESLPRRNRGADDSIPMRVAGAPQTSRARGIVRGSAEISNQRYLRPMLQHVRLLAVGIIGCLISVSFTLCFPDLGLAAEQFNPFAVLKRHDLKAERLGPPLACSGSFRARYRATPAKIP